MLPGGAGDIGIGPDGRLEHGHNFLVRSRDLWVQRGFAVLIPDTVDGIRNLRGKRSTPQYATVVAALVASAHAQAAVPVVLMGTSQGSIAAVNGAAHLRRGEIAALVLTESVSRLGGSHETVFSAHPDRINVPVLIVANSDDRCKVAPPQDAPKIAAAMTRAPLVKIREVSGGTMHGTNACGSLTPHGYDGIEPKVVDAVATWLGARL
ncbi:MAG: alpha/beta hydrolase [Proteobacteria bacterium]|nr:alpha/beta hydrolase [Pseudomonadota bacterium]